MRISISNIAWATDLDDDVAQILRENEIDAIDIAPPKYFPDPGAASNDQILEVKHWWQERGIEIVGMQSLLFGTTGLNLFSNDEQIVSDMLEHLTHICRIAEALGAKFLVFGSPKNRDRSGLDEQHTLNIARRFFHRLGDIAGNHGVTICLEPNPVAYGANFMVDTPSTAAVVEVVDHPAIRMQLDIGALTMNHEDPDEMLQAYAPLIAHIHASEPQLKVLGTQGSNHEQTAATIRRYCPEKIVTIEMVEDAANPLDSIRNALKIAKAHYGTAPR